MNEPRQGGLREAALLAKHKIEQTLEGQYPEGQALKAALYVLTTALSDEALTNSATRLCPVCVARFSLGAKR